MNDSAKRQLPIAVLISGGGTTLRNLLAKITDGALDARIRLVIPSNPDAKGIEFASRASIPVAVIERKSFPNESEFGEAVFGACRQAKVELVVMGGFLKHVPIPSDFVNRVVNI